jgi:hypothetical protein
MDEWSPGSQSLEYDVSAWSPGLAIEDPSVAINETDRPGNPRSVRLEGTVRAADPEIRIGEQRERKPQPGRVRSMALNRGWIHAKRTNVLLGVRLDLIAHGGELAVSAGCVVARVKNQKNPGLPEQLVKLVRLAVRCLGGEIRRGSVRWEECHEAADVREPVCRSSSRSSHSLGTCCEPMVP